MSADRPHVGLFVTCLVDMMRPSVGFASVKLLEQAGCTVDAPAAQTCCGQPAYNSGDRATTRQMALNMIEAFEPFDYVVAPSGSCAGMLRKHYPGLFEEGSQERERAEAVAAKTHELVSFLTDVMKMKSVDAALEQNVTYHDSCSGYRELGIKAQPRKLLKTVKGLTVTEMKDAEICCGFGGTFCVKYPDISNDMVTKKIANIEASGADTVLAGDLGCLMNMAGKLKRQGSKVQVRHVAEVLAGVTDTPAIAERGK
ncbi:MAG: (Fe-S)-binding protein [Hyphomicrobiales bacterium]|nr:(Fe-S)-binding protein [Hyphomicrobiales bacterium]